MTSESVTSFWPRVKKHIREQKSAVEGPLKCHCPVCLDPLDIVDLPDTAQDRQPAKVLPCGHMYCTKCLDSLKDSGYQRCPTCRLGLVCHGCCRMVGLAHVPTHCRTLEAIDGVRLTTSEGGRHGSHCLTCVQNIGWSGRIRARKYPDGAKELPCGFVPLVYNIMEMLELNGARPTKTGVLMQYDQMMSEHFETMISHMQWNFMLRGGWPAALEALLPGFVQFFFAHIIYAQTTGGDGGLRSAFTNIFRGFMNEHFDKLDQARAEYFADQAARFEDENIWFGDLRT